MKTKLLQLIIAGITAAAIVLVYSCSSLPAAEKTGRNLYLSKCSSCHSVLEPPRYDYVTWVKYVDKYGQGMSSREKEIILSYLRYHD